MSLQRPPKSMSMTLNLAPMVDVMMCLIIFFLIASQLATERFPVDLPWAISAKQVDEAQLGNRVTISVRPSEESDDSAEYVVTDWDGQQVTQRRLQPSDVEYLLLKRSEQALRDGQPVRCVINADKRVRYKDVELVLRACGLAKISSIVFPTRIGEGAEVAP